MTSAEKRQHQCAVNAELYLSFLRSLLFALSFLLIINRGGVISCIMEEEFTEALNGQHIQGPFTGLDEISQPRHRLRRGLDGGTIRHLESPLNMALHKEQLC